MGNTENLLLDLMLLARSVLLVLEDEILDGVSGVKLNPSRLAVLRLLSRRKRQSVNDLARFLAQTKASASQNVDWMVKADLVRRQPDENDRRGVWISLTPRGRRVLGRVEARQSEVLKSVARKLSRKRVATLREGMREMAFLLLEHAESDATRCLQCCAYDNEGCVCENGTWSCRYLAEGEKTGVSAGKGARR